MLSNTLAAGFALAVVSAGPTQKEGGFGSESFHTRQVDISEFDVKCYNASYNLDISQILQLTKEFEGYRSLTYWPIHIEVNVRIAQAGGVYITGQRVVSNELNPGYFGMAQSRDISQAIKLTQQTCKFAGGSALAIPAKDVRIHVGAKWYGSTIPSTPKKRQDVSDVRPPRPGLAPCDPKTECFHTCDHYLYTCLINAKINMVAIEDCYRKHSDCLGNTCGCSDVDDGTGYPVLSDANTCFILCRATMLECHSDFSHGGPLCETAYHICMHDCMPDDAANHGQRHPLADTLSSPKDSLLPNCNSTTACFGSCDLGLYGCLIEITKTVQAAANCWLRHTICTAKECSCDDATDLNGHPILSKAGTCMKWSWSGYTLCSGVSCDSEFRRSIDGCSRQISTKNPTLEITSVKRQAARHFRFYYEGNLKGYSELVSVNKGQCFNAVDSFHPDRWRSLSVNFDEACIIYGQENCAGKGNQCAKEGLKVVCNIDTTNGPVKSIFCFWDLARKRELGTAVPTIRKINDENLDVVGLATKRQIASTRSIEFFTGWHLTGRMDIVMVQNGKCAKVGNGGKYGSVSVETDMTCALYGTGECGGSPFWCSTCNLVLGPNDAVTSIFCTWKVDKRAITSAKRSIGRTKSDTDSTVIEAHGTTPTDLVPKRQISSARTIEFYSELDCKGQRTDFLIPASKCYNFREPIGSDFYSYFLEPLENCSLYESRDCKGGGLMCNRQMTPGVATQCNFRANVWGSNTWYSMFCTWP